MAGRLGGFHFNDSKYGDDDLTVGSIHPYQFFLIVLELLEHGDGAMPPLAYMIDPCNNLKDPIEDLVQATDQIQLTLAQALSSTGPPSPPRRTRNDPALAAEILQRGVPHRRPPARRRGPPAQRRRARPAHGVPAPRLPRRGRRERAARGTSPPACRVRVAAVDFGATSVRVAVVDLERRAPTSRSSTAGSTARTRGPTAPCAGTGASSSTTSELGLDRALAAGPLASIGIDAWGVDYGLLDEDGRLLSDPHSYRSPRTAASATSRRTLGEAELYQRTGVQLMPINTIFQLAAHDRDELRRAPAS